jgi:hypothetical protein
MASKAPAPSVEEIELARQAAESLRSQRCLCGGRKREEQSFCLRCYHKLPEAVRAGLYSSFRDGYARHYAAAKQYLEKLKSGAMKVMA